jgi:L,D-transpeptidase catalytic domain
VVPRTWARNNVESVLGKSTLGKSTSAKLSGTISDRAGLGGLRAALVSTVALAVLSGLTTSADAYYPRRIRYFAPPGWSSHTYTHRVRVAAHRNQERSEQPKKEVGFGEMPKGPLQLAVNISTQKVTLYSNGVRVAQGPVSTGMPGHPTPMGVFSIIEKDRYHHSNIYSGAPMPFMQRITWSGVAIHEGVLPGHPASHGCIRTSHDFAQRLWPITKLGVRFIVARSEIVPVDFEHPKLFVPRQKPPEARVASNAQTDGRASAPIMVAQAEPEAGSGTVADTGKSIPVPTGERSAAEAQPVETVPPAVDVKMAAPSPLGEPAEERVGPTGTAAPTRATSEAPAHFAPDELRKSVEVPGSSERAASAATPPGEPTETAAEEGPAKPAPTIDPAKPPAPARTKSADQPIKRTGQVAVFVSRKEKKIFVRQGMTPMFEMPIMIQDPDQPLGLHVFTAMGTTEDGAGMRWNLMTVPTDGTPMPEYRSSRKRGREQAAPMPATHLKAPSTAAEALDRIQMPQEAVDRISELLVPGSSLVIADDGLGRETGRGTEFIVLTR